MTDSGVGGRIEGGGSSEGNRSGGSKGGGEVSVQVDWFFAFGRFEVVWREGA